MPLTAYMLQVQSYKIKCGPGLCDLSQMDNSQAGKDKLKEVMKGFTPTASADPRKEFKKLLFMPYSAMDYAAQRQCRMALTYNLDASDEQKADSLAAMAELGAVGRRVRPTPSSAPGSSPSRRNRWS